MLMVLNKKYNGVKMIQLHMKMIVQIFIVKVHVYNYHLYVHLIYKWVDVSNYQEMKNKYYHVKILLVIIV